MMTQVNLSNQVTSDHIVCWIDLAPQVAAFLAFLKVVSQNISSSSVGWWGPTEVDTVLEGSDNLWS